MGLSARLRTKISNYLDEGDRGREPFFAGREYEVNLVAKNLNMLRSGSNQGRTICLSGPPGIGKTAFISALEEKLHEHGDEYVVVIKTSRGSFHDPKAILQSIAEGIPIDWMPKERFSALKDARRAIGLAKKEITGIRIPGFAIQMACPNPDNLRQGEFPAGEVNDLMSSAPPSAAIILCVDEAHKLSHADRGNDILTDIHEAAKAPVLPLFAGHGNTPDVLRPSISNRWADDNERPMQPLCSSDAIIYVEKILKHLEIEGPQSHHDRITLWVVDESDGWPHHLRNAMASIAKECLRSDSVTPQSWNGALIATELSERLVRYYKQRFRGKLKHSVPIVSGFLRQLETKPKPHNDHVVYQAACEYLDGVDHPHAKNLLHRNNISEPNGLFDAMVAEGVLSRSEPKVDHDYVWACPITSLRNYADTLKHTYKSDFPRPSVGYSQ